MLGVHLPIPPALSAHTAIQAGPADLHKVMTCNWNLSRIELGEGGAGLRQGSKATGSESKWNWNRGKDHQGDNSLPGASLKTPESCCSGQADSREVQGWARAAAAKTPLGTATLQSRRLGFES